MLISRGVCMNQTYKHAAAQSLQSQPGQFSRSRACFSARSGAKEGTDEESDAFGGRKARTAAIGVQTQLCYNHQRVPAATLALCFTSNNKLKAHERSLPFPWQRPSLASAAPARLRLASLATLIRCSTMSTLKRQKRYSCCVCLPSFTSRNMAIQKYSG